MLRHLIEAGSATTFEAECMNGTQYDDVVVCFTYFWTLRPVLRTHSVKQISDARTHAKDTRGKGKGHFQIAADQQQQTFSIFRALSRYHIAQKTIFGIFSATEGHFRHPQLIGLTDFRDHASR